MFDVISWIIMVLLVALISAWLWFRYSIRLLLKEFREDMKAITYEWKRAIGKSLDELERIKASWE